MPHRVTPETPAPTRNVKQYTSHWLEWSEPSDDNLEWNEEVDEPEFNQKQEEESLNLRQEPTDLNDEDYEVPDEIEVDYLVIDLELERQHIIDMDRMDDVLAEDTIELKSEDWDELFKNWKESNNLNNNKDSRKPFELDGSIEQLIHDFVESENQNVTSEESEEFVSVDESSNEYKSSDIKKAIDEMVKADEILDKSEETLQHLDMKLKGF
eukprot:TRINITY_DN44393_c0_g1_i2.p1 TRINITY_DN44393_c0_g1~~TRINITY_DN44393_c0_g1_i2.p1  ORF type:complete len:211 (-),score=70.65 TRINITY_DN44393_c0_g1_i2:224-856(-)